VGLESLAVPFCMTVEAEMLGAAIEMGGRLVQPRPAAYPVEASRQVMDLAPPDWSSGRAGVVLAAVRELAEARPDVPVIGNLVGPVSLAGSLIEPGVLLREMRRRPQDVAEGLAALSRMLQQFGREQVAAGADVVTIAEPTATGDILGPRLFERLAAPALRSLVEEMHRAGAPVIVHICGRAATILGQLAAIGADAISVDEMVGLRSLRDAVAPAAVMGNISAFALENGPPERIRRWCLGVGLPQAEIVAPACGLVVRTPAAHVLAFTETVKASGVVMDDNRGQG